MPTFWCCAKTAANAPPTSRASWCTAGRWWRRATGAGRPRRRERFRPLPAAFSEARAGLAQPELAVYSGDTVRRDAEGFLYFVGRRDEMIKTSGYRVSPTEVEACVAGSGLVQEVLAVGRAHDDAGAGDRGGGAALDRAPVAMPRPTPPRCWRIAGRAAGLHGAGAGGLGGRAVAAQSQWQARSTAVEGRT